MPVMQSRGNVVKCVFSVNLLIKLLVIIIVVVLCD